MSKEEEKNIKKTDTPKQELPPIIDDDGINLVPIMTKKEVVAEKRKAKVNLGAVLSIVLFLFITIAVVAFSTISKLQLNNEKEKLFALENDIKGLSTKVLDNQEVLKRVYLYKNISSSQFSARKIFDYFSEVAKKQGDVSFKSFIFGSDKQHAFEGSADSLDTASKLWYLLQKDKNVESVVMDNLSKRSDSVDFSFKVTLIPDAFKSLDEDQVDVVKQPQQSQGPSTNDSDSSWEDYKE